MGKVLIVEDNELNLKLFRDLLIIKDYEVITSTNGIGVEELAAKNQPELILMDIQLGDLSGVDIIKELKVAPKTKHIPIIAITALAMKKDEVAIAASGCDLYLPKPVSIGDFFHAVESFIKQPINQGV